jgi:anti-sigma factor RsiW
MNHSEAIEQMAAERYLLDELAPEAREEFEEHVFDCPECALDLRAGIVFVSEAKAQLPGMEAMTTAKAGRAKANGKPNFWAALWRPAFAAPAFAALLVVVLYQNLVTFPALRDSATQPRLVPLAPLHGATRGATRLSLTADRAHGVALPVDLAAEPGVAPAASYAFELRDPQGKAAWTSTIPAPPAGADGEQPFSLVIPGKTLENGTYSLTVTSVSAQGERTPVQEYIFDIVVSN